MKPRRANVLAELTSIAQREASRLVGAVREEVDNGKVPVNLDFRPLALMHRWRAAPVKAGHHLATGAAAIQQLHHVRQVGQVKEGEAEVQCSGAGDLHCPVAGPARFVAVWEVRRVKDPRWGGVVPPAGTHLGCRVEEDKRERRWSFRSSVRCRVSGSKRDRFLI